MKKLISLLAASLVAASAFAQIGVVAGVTSSQSNIQSAVEHASGMNQYHLGIAMKVDLGLFAIQPELLYNVKGQTIESIGTDGMQAMSFKTGYLELPVQLQAGVKLGRLARIYAFGEPFLGYAVTNEKSVSESINDVKNNWENTWDNVKNRMEYGFGLGFGADIFETVQLSVKYFWNLGNIYGSKASIEDIKNTVTEEKCNGIAASLAIFF